MGEYHDLYLRTDILLLTDVFDFRAVCLKNYKLDPCHYVSTPGLSWDSMLKYTEVNLELMTDVDMHQFFERGIRGGISVITHRYAKANNFTILKMKQVILCILMQIVFMVGQWCSHYHMVVFDG